MYRKLLCDLLEYLAGQRRDLYSFASVYHHSEREIKQL